MTLLRILGVGSPFGDDTVGWKVVDCLKAMPALQPFGEDLLELVACDRPGPALLRWMTDTDNLWIVDACVSNAPPGTIHVTGKDALETLASPYSTHGFGVSEAIRLAESLSECPDNIRIFGIEISPTACFAGLSEAVAEAVPVAAALVAREALQKMTSGCPGR